uniref:Uncharacterized protein LOC102804474 n=1 Tax=Saccoglossus kowalevskii TaxID=10224 RepID=A0ABM0M4Y1_SACKO|nr:PREDICTED: uncharacterized protein LOC102804474 [Saccoglossus kowalevskii]
MNILLDVLSEVKTHLAKVLYLQLDNCFRENKNRFLLSLMELMVEINVFEEIFVSFLPVGHTHENVDQMFSKISTKLGHRNTYTIDDLEETVTASYTPPIKSCGLLKKPLYNIKDWLLPHITGKMQGHSKPHNFRFHKVGGRAYMQYRLWCTDKWQPTTIDANGDQVPGLRCLKSIPGRDDVPSFVIPSLEKMDADALNLDIPRRYGMRLPVAAVQWWNDFFTNVKELEKVPSETPSSWILYDLKDHAVEKRNLRNQIEDPRVGQNVMDIEERLTLPCPRVTVTGGMPVMADHVDNYNSIAVNDMIAIYCPEYDEIPQIGKVLSRDDDKFIIHWYKGSWRTAWKPFYLFQGRKRVPYQDEEPVEAAIYWGFSLNGRNMLSKETQIILHEKYDDAKLIDAAANGDIKEVKRLLAEGYDVNFRNKDGNTALHLATWNRHGKVVDLFINHGIEMNMKGYFEKTALHYAAENGELGILKKLVAAGADMEARAEVNYHTMSVSELNLLLECREEST